MVLWTSSIRSAFDLLLRWALLTFASPSLINCVFLVVVMKYSRSHFAMSTVHGDENHVGFPLFSGCSSRIWASCCIFHNTHTTRCASQQSVWIYLVGCVITCDYRKVSGHQLYMLWSQVTFKCLVSWAHHFNVHKYGNGQKRCPEMSF